MTGPDIHYRTVPTLKNETSGPYSWRSFIRYNSQIEIEDSPQPRSASGIFALLQQATGKFCLLAVLRSLR